MHIGEISNGSGISTSCIRASAITRSTVSFPKAVRGKNGYREYPDTAVKMITLIVDSQRMGFSLPNHFRKSSNQLGIETDRLFFDCLQGPIASLRQSHH